MPASPPDILAESRLCRACLRLPSRVEQGFCKPCFQRLRTADFHATRMVMRDIKKFELPELDRTA
ncbi:MAG TPA: hypothetical protein VIC32_05060 [Terriglobales bacterium]